MIRSLVNEDLNDVFNLGLLLHDNFNSLYDYGSLLNDVDKTYVINIDNKVVGFIHVKVLIDEIDIIDLVISESYRNKGYASELLRYVIDLYKDSKFILEVAADNVNAVNLYNKFNFNQIGIRKRYYNGIDAIVMERV